MALAPSVLLLWTYRAWKAPHSDRVLLGGGMCLLLFGLAGATQWRQACSSGAKWQGILKYQKDAGVREMLDMQICSSVQTNCRCKAGRKKSN
jgi:hypothetical protein